MIQLKHKKIAVIGLTDQGRAFIRFAHQQGGEVTAFGLPSEKVARVLRKMLQSISFRLVAEEISPDAFLPFDIIIVSSGADRIYKAQIESARQHGNLVVSDLELACEYYKAPIIAVTGSNGKTTVLHMIKTALELAGKKVIAAGGFFGTLPNSIRHRGPYDFVLLELNSTRLMRAQHFRPHIAVFLNLYPGHSERHESLEEYGAAKAKIFTEQTSEDFFVFHAVPEVTDLLHKFGCKAKSYAFSSTKPVKPGAFFNPEKREVVFVSEEGIESNFSYVKSGWVGPHHLENILAAVCVAKICRISDETIQEMIPKIPPLPNRMEYVREIDGVVYINDFRSSNVGSTANALNSCGDHEGILIVGGIFRADQSYESLNPIIKKKVKTLIIIGKDRLRLLDKWKEAAETCLAENLKEAVELANQKAEKGTVVLFSPSCSPELRADGSTPPLGDEFKEIVNEFDKARRRE